MQNSSGLYICKCYIKIVMSIPQKHGKTLSSKRFEPWNLVPICESKFFSTPQVPVGFLTNNVETIANSLRIDGSFNIV